MSDRVVFALCFQPRGLISRVVRSRGQNCVNTTVWSSYVTISDRSMSWRGECLVLVTEVIKGFYNRFVAVSG